MKITITKHLEIDIHLYYDGT